MKLIGLAFRLALRALCYLALAAVVAAIAIMVVTTKLGLCDFPGGAPATCLDPRLTGWAHFALGMVYASAFTGVPLLLALGGLVFLVRDAMKLRGRGRSSR